MEFPGIKRMWSLGSSIGDPFDTFLVLSFIRQTQILTMNPMNELEETQIEGFCSHMQTLFCHEAVYNQHVQVGFLTVLLDQSLTSSIDGKCFWMI